MHRDFEEKLMQITGEESVYVNEPMSRHTTFRIGGTADYFVLPNNIEEIQQIIRLCHKEDMPCYILGNGSNLLVSDRGYQESSFRSIRR